LELPGASHAYFDIHLAHRDPPQSSTRVSIERDGDGSPRRCSVHVRHSLFFSHESPLTLDSSSHIPSVVIASFGDIDTHTSETKFVKASGGLNLGLLHDVHGIYRAVVHDEIGVEEGSIALTRMLRADPIYNLWQRMIIAGICAGTIAPMGFGGSFVDGWVAGGFGAMLAFLQLYAAKKNAIFSNIFE
jgi:uncharacterized membrane protein YjjP (DUF1212 family)